MQVAQLKMNLAAAAEEVDAGKTKLEKFKSAATEKLRADRVKYTEHLKVSSAVLQTQNTNVYHVLKQRCKSCSNRMQLCSTVQGSLTVVKRVRVTAMNVQPRVHTLYM